MAEEGHGGQQWFVDEGQQQVVLTLRGSAWHDGLVIGCFVCGLGGLCARQCWAADVNDMLCKTLGWLVLTECMDLYEWADGSYLVCC